MRLLLALAALAGLLLAGCTASDDGAPPNADPAGPHGTLPPTPSDNTTGPATGTPTGSYSLSSTTTGPASQPGSANFPPHSAEDSASDDDFSGVAVNGRVTGSGARLALEATANKFSPAGYRVPDGQCAQPWTESLRGPDGSTVQHREPTATCQAFGLRAMEQNEAISVRLEWDGTVWDEAASGYVRAPSGTYTWAATFHIYSGGSGAEYTDSAELTLEFEVRVP